MTEQNIDTTSTDDFDDDDAQEASQEQGNPDPEETDLRDEGKKAIDRMKAQRAEALKQVRALRTELDQFRAASMSEAELAVQEAEKRGRSAATAEYGKRLVRASFDSLAAKRNPGVNTDDIVEFVDMSRFLNEDGDVDKRALQQAVNRLVPEPHTDPSFDGGPRGKSAPKTTDMNTIIRNQALGHRSA